MRLQWGNGGWREERMRGNTCIKKPFQKCQCVVWGSTNTPPSAGCYSVTCAAREDLFSPPCAVFPILSVYWRFLCTSNQSAMSTITGRAFLDTSAYITHISTPTQTQLPEGLLSITACVLYTWCISGESRLHAETAGKNISREKCYGPCPTADLGWASLFQILTSTTAVEIPTLTPDQHLRLSSCGNREQTTGGPDLGQHCPLMVQEGRCIW